MDNLQGREILLTGASGFLGTALTARLVLDSHCGRVHVLCRGGATRLYDRWFRSLPQHLYQQILCKIDSIEVHDGDITHSDLGIPSDTMARLHSTVEVVIHCASSIDLTASMSSVRHSVIEGALNVAKFAKSCTTFRLFVFVSTAYVNTFLHTQHDDIDTVVSERVYPLGESSAEEEWKVVQETTDIPTDLGGLLPWPYAYAKHLTERLLISALRRTDEDPKEMPQQLLIVRPSIIGPADSFPAPGWQIECRAPVTILFAAWAFIPALSMTCSSRFTEPAQLARVNEVPVDIVVNRILCHIAEGSNGVVHAACEYAQRISIGEYYDAASTQRGIPWRTRLIWKDLPWHTNETCLWSRIYRIEGTAFHFESHRTHELWKEMTPEDKCLFPLFSGDHKRHTDGSLDLSAREAGIQRLLARQLRQWRIPFANFLASILFESREG